MQIIVMDGHALKPLHLVSFVICYLFKLDPLILQVLSAGGVDGVEVRS
jgi:hypothetical protein